MKKEVLVQKIFGITGDGAFTKGNAPFKNRMFEILGKEVTVRWDLLHLINRAHHEARGKFLQEDDLTFEETETNETESNEEGSMKTVKDT